MEAKSSARFHAVAPGVVQTLIYGGFMSKQEIPDVVPISGPMHPLGPYLEIRNVVAAISPLASPRTALIAGVPIEGGVTTRLPAAA